jgi:aminoglycoside 6'-N-acetyltransferase I
MAEYKLKKFDRDLLDDLVSLRCELWDRSEKEKYYEEVKTYLEGGNAAFLAYKDDDPIGFIELRIKNEAEGCPSCPIGYIEGWYVHPDHRGRGIGNGLILKAELWAKQFGCVFMASDTELDNTYSIDAHRRRGYKEHSKLIHFTKKI